MRQLFPQPLTQRFQAPVVPPVETRNTQHPPQRQPCLQRSSQDIRMDPHFKQPPPQYSQVQQHRRMQAPLIEVNEMGPTIQQGMMQHPVQRGMQSHTGAGPKDVQQTGNVPPSREDNRGNRMSVPEENGGDSLPERNEDLFHNGYVLNCIHEGRPFPLSDVTRPAFVNH